MAHDADVGWNVQCAPDAVKHCANSKCEKRAYSEGKNRGTIQLKQCKGCLQVAYCSRDCQKAHWPQHKEECRRATASKEGRTESRADILDDGAAHAIVCASKK